LGCKSWTPQRRAALRGCSSRPAIVSAALLVARVLQGNRLAERAGPYRCIQPLGSSIAPLREQVGSEVALLVRLPGRRSRPLRHVNRRDHGTTRCGAAAWASPFSEVCWGRRCRRSSGRCQVAVARVKVARRGRGAARALRTAGCTSNYKRKTRGIEPRRLSCTTSRGPARCWPAAPQSSGTRRCWRVPGAFCLPPPVVGPCVGAR